MEVVNAFTVDVEDWYQAVTSLNVRQDEWDKFEARVQVNTERLSALLDEYDIQATYFILGKVAEEYPDLIRQLDASGHEIGIHGYSHLMIDRLSPQQFREEITRALDVITPLVSQPILGHRAPYFSINKRSLWALDILKENGFQYDSSFFATRNVLYGFPESPRFPHRISDSDIVEFPLSTAVWFGVKWPIAGGFYTRALPYSVIKKGIRQLNHQGYPAILYIHPWELDTTHRYNRITTREWLVQYTGRKNLEGKLRRLFRDFKFAPLRNLLEFVD